MVFVYALALALLPISVPETQAGNWSCADYFAEIGQFFRGSNYLGEEGNARIQSAFTRAYTFQSPAELESAFHQLRDEYARKALAAGSEKEKQKILAEQNRALTKRTHEAKKEALAARGPLTPEAYARVEAAFAQAYASRKRDQLEAAHGVIDQEYDALFKISRDQHYQIKISHARLGAHQRRRYQYAAMVAEDPAAAALTPLEELLQLKHGQKLFTTAWDQGEVLVRRNGEELGRGIIDDFHVERKGDTIALKLNGKSIAVQSTDEVSVTAPPPILLTPIHPNSTPFRNANSLRQEYFNALDRGLPADQIRLTMQPIIEENLGWMNQQLPNVFKNLGEQRAVAEKLMRRIQAMRKQKDFSYHDYILLSRDFSALMNYQPNVFPRFSAFEAAGFAQEVGGAEFFKSRVFKSLEIFNLPMAQPLDVKQINQLLAEGINPYGLVTEIIEADGRKMPPLEFFEHDHAHARFFGQSRHPNELKLEQKSRFYRDFEAWAERISTSQAEKDLMEQFWFDLFHERGVIIHPTALKRFAAYEADHLGPQLVDTKEIRKKAMLDSLREFVDMWDKSEGRPLAK